jgi:cbb3-type cytochrome oxidase subunit 1
MTATVDQGTSSRQPSAQSGPGAGRSAPDSAATRYLFASTAFLALGAVLALGALVSMRFPGLFPISLGRLRPMAMIALLLGWLVPGMAAGLFYALPRLTGTPLRGDGRANAALPAIIAVVLGGIAIVLLGWGDGRAPFALPWWWDIPVLGLLSVPFLIVAGSLRDRREEVVYPTLWFAVAGVVWLPALYLIGNLPELSSVATALSDLVFEAGFISVWGLGVATGLAYYVVPKASGQPLANRQLARVGFWSLLFGGVFMGPAQLVAGPAPEWLQGVAAVLGLAFPIGALANTTNLALTIGPEWRDIGSRPVLLAAMAGSGLEVSRQWRPRWPDSDPTGCCWPLRRSGTALLICSSWEPWYWSSSRLPGTSSPTSLEGRCGPRPGPPASSVAAQ